MNPWLSEDWQEYFSGKANIPNGIYLRIEKNVNDDVKKSLKKFAKWLRKNYKFPIMLPIYVKATDYVKTKDGDYVVGSFLNLMIILQNLILKFLLVIMKIC